jgi:hypothetical protein
VNRAEFAARIESAMVEHAWLDSYGGPTLEEQADKIAEELWPVLLQAWDEGFLARTLMAYGLAGPQRNPYYVEPGSQR